MKRFRMHKKPLLSNSYFASDCLPHPLCQGSSRFHCRTWGRLVSYEVLCNYLCSVARLIRPKLLTDAEMSGHSVPKCQLPCIDLSSGDDSRIIGKLCRHQCLR